MILRGGIFFTAIPATLEDGNVRLRHLRISDGAFLKTGFGGRESLKANGLCSPLSLSGEAIRLWIRNTYDLAWCIEIDSQPTGFAGVFHLRPGESAEVSLMVFKPELRGRGYGGTVFRMIAEMLALKTGIKLFIVRVRNDNVAALSFWLKMGFEYAGREDGIKVMALDSDDCFRLKMRLT